MNLRLLLLVAGALWAAPCLAAAQPEGGSTFPQESLVGRIAKIMDAFRVDITYEEALVRGATAPAVQGASSADEALGGSLRGNGLAYRKLNDKSYVIVRGTEAAGGPSAPQQQGRGRIAGTVVDKDGFPIPGAAVVIAGTTTGVATDVKGEFSLELPARTVTVEVSCISFQKVRISDVKVVAGKTTPFDIILQDATEELDEVVVTATYNKASANALYAIQQARMVMSDGISADLIKRTADNNVAQVLSRVSGVTIDNGKYVTVRGMGERYNNVQLNGASLPSTEPNRRNFAFDVLPSNLIDNVTIAKTFTPDLPGEFTGGLVEVNTLAIPVERTISLSVGTGINTNSTGKDFLSGKRYGADYLFGEIDKRQWYGGQDAEAAEQNRENLIAMNSYGLHRYKAAPTQNYAFTIGYPFELRNGNKLGFVASLTYRNEQNIEDLPEGRMITRDSLFLPGHRYKFATAAGAVANIGWEAENHKVTWRNLYNSRFTQNTTARYIYKEYNGRNDYEEYFTPLTNRLFQTQLEGKHDLFNQSLTFTWNASYNKITRTNPDDRLARGEWKGKAADDSDMIDWTLATYSTNPYTIEENHAMYSNLEENKKNIAANIEYPFAVQGNQQKIKMGYMGTFRHANFEQQYFKARGSIGLNDERYGLTAQEYFATENFGEDGFLEYVISGMQANDADFYEGDQHIHAAYLMGEFTFLRKLHLTGGVRMEDARTETTTQWRYSSADERPDTTVVNDATDWLPAATLVFNATDKFNIRFAYSKTLARPDFRELSRTSYYNVDDRVFVYNRGMLKQSYSNNYDLRVEWYPQVGEVISLSGFIKKFKDPVEMITQMESSMQKFNIYSINLDEATVKGIELNVRKSLGFIAPGSFLQDVYLSGNATLIKGDVNYTALRNEENIRRRPLMGLAPYTVNAGLSYQGNIFGASLNYGRNGRKLVMSGDYEKYDQYEAPRDILDLQISTRLLKERMEIKFNASDLLQQDVVVYRNCSWNINYDNNTEPDGAYTDLTALGMNYDKGDWVLNRTKKGVSLSLSVSYKF